MNPTLHAQILTLRKYQAWRTGEDERTMDEAGIVPGAITSALDAVLDFAESHLRDATKKHATQACNLQPSEPAPSDEEIERAMADAMGRLVPVSEFRWWDGWPGTRSFAQAALKAYRNLMAIGQQTENRS